MKKRITTFLMLLLAGTVMSCGKSGIEFSETCNNTVGAVVVSANGTVTYTAIASGESTINAITYLTSGGPVTITNPGSSFSKTENVNAGDQINISVTGMAKNGRITIGYNFPDPVDPKISQVYCGN